jgi:hypothetical protein
MSEICESKSGTNRAKTTCTTPSLSTTQAKDSNIEKILDSLLRDGKQPPEELVGNDGGSVIAMALERRLDNEHVQPSRAAHAMCGSAAKGCYAVVQVLAKRPASTFNKAYNLSEPLRRACRSWARETDSEQRRRRLLCAVALVQADANLDDPDKYLKSRQSAREAINSIEDEKVSAKFFEDLWALSGKEPEESKGKSQKKIGGAGSKRKRG